MFKATNTSAAVRDAPSSWCRLDILGHRLYYGLPCVGSLPRSVAWCLFGWPGSAAALETGQGWTPQCPRAFCAHSYLLLRMRCRQCYRWCGAAWAALAHRGK
jgi:hypothetical protein